MDSEHSLLRKPFETYVFMDLEATGLQPSQPKITELCLIAVTRHALENTEHSGIFRSIPIFPRVVDKLSLCVNPEKPFTPVASTISGLSNDLLRVNKRQAFNIHVFHMIEAFLKRQTPPMCFVAHNGYNYDFPLLKAELAGKDFPISKDIYCGDSLTAMKALDQANRSLYSFAGLRDISGRKSYRLRDLYFRFFKEEPADSHTAEGDTIALLAIFQMKARVLIKWMDLNAKQFDDIKAMYKDPLKEQTKMASSSNVVGKITPTQNLFFPHESARYQSLRKNLFDSEEQQTTTLYSSHQFNWITHIYNNFNVTYFMLALLALLILQIFLSL
ncbi:three-prime repair exonuclease 1-like isoform X2 [Rhinatrema bivittatum]|nr:three-prime repair exonuclease 1-like isoform X2 [Rhinatrema bivittatum]XP_029455259.1 three-prime repair exonuclease 1-like isoform X2 [Rhinatrema bivittatum]XP_029455260.1 three-prime repair exonuclease 1-like isoform X2 [Rhinatrema bivittatum]XP_029455261.1 three-prime repair exonuclease 1-like isoform X2 [Rhinatrema bivittatum]